MPQTAKLTTDRAAGQLADGALAARRLAAFTARMQNPLGTIV
jgi:hypothetical protein